MPSSAKPIRRTDPDDDRASEPVDPLRQRHSDAGQLRRSPSRVASSRFIGGLPRKSAVLDAARRWLGAKEEVLAADEGVEDPVETERFRPRGIRTDRRGL